MQASLFDDPVAGTETIKANLSATGLTARQKLLLLALNLIPLLQIITLALLLFWPSSWLWRALIGVAALYLLPPALATIVRKAWLIPEGRIAVGSTAFFAWWALLQLQMIFCRFSSLEEALRLVPGLYSLWLRLWGARIGRLTFWSPGTVIMDRSYLQVGNDVVFGADVRINPHMIVKNSQGAFELLLATVRIGDGARVGGYALLAPGAEIAADEVTDALLVLPPFSTFKNGKRSRVKEKQ
ncbi:MAG: acyltransferase [Candidatus Binatia bacterium]